MRMTLVVITSILLTLALGCGDSDTVEADDSTEPTADAGIDVAEATSEEEEEDVDAKDDDPDVEPRVMHTRLNGDIEAPLSCDDICAAESMVCDPEYHTFIGTGGCRAFWGPVEDMLRCDEAPKKLRTSYTGNVFELSEFECYCLAPTE